MKKIEANITITEDSKGNIVKLIHGFKTEKEAKQFKNLYNK